MSVAQRTIESVWRSPIWPVIAAIATLALAFQQNKVGSQANAIAALQLQIEADRKAREDEERKPKIVYIRNAHEFDGHDMKLTFQNRSPQTDALITSARFQITDPRQLDRIEALEPEPVPAAASPRATASAAIPFDDTVFHHGYWAGKEIYEFAMNPGMMILKSETIAFKFSIENRFFAGERFFGRLIIEYDGNDPTKVDDVTIVAKHPQRQARNVAP